MKRQVTLLILLFKFTSFSAFSQNIGLNFNSFYGIWNNEIAAYNYGGGGMELYFEQPIKLGAIRSGIAYRFIDWGSQISIEFAYNSPYILKDNYALRGISSAGIGLALFKENPLFVWSIGYMPEFTWLRKKRIDLNIGFGIRYTHNPAYKKYGKINQVLEFPIKIGFKLNLKSKNSSLK